MATTIHRKYAANNALIRRSKAIADGRGFNGGGSLSFRLCHAGDGNGGIQVQGKGVPYSFLFNGLAGRFFLQAALLSNHKYVIMRD